jgi:[CysO sulfur-carrier protein]-S-L-cysteine hydrolase
MAHHSTLPEDLSTILKHLESCYPNEGCGLVLRDPQGRLRVRLMQNAYDRYHAKDPVTYPRTSRTAYLFDPREQMAVYEESERGGEQVACIFHSHGDAGAYFSAEDKAMAAPDGVPMHPGVSYLVVAVDQGASTAARLYTWKDGDFEELVIPLGR